MASSSSDNNINIRVSTTGIPEASQDLQGLADDASAAQLQVAKASDTATASLQKQLTAWTNRVDPAARAQEQLAKGQTVFNDALAAGLITGDQQASLLAKLEDKYGSGAAAVAAYGAAHEEAGVKLGGMREMITGVSSAATGNITGLARAGAMLGNSWGLITNPVVLGVGAIAGAIVAATMRGEELQSETAQLDVALKGIGDTSGVTAQQLMQLAQSLEAAGASRSEAQALVLQGARSGNLTPQGIGEMSQIAMGMSAATGDSSSAEMQKLLGVVQQGYPAIEKLDEALNLFSADELKQIEVMEEHGDKVDALVLVIQALEARYGDLREQSMTPLQQKMHDLGTAWDDLLDKLSKSPVVGAGLSAFGAYLEHLAELSTRDGMVQNSSGAWVVPPQAAHPPGSVDVPIPPEGLRGSNGLDTGAGGALLNTNGPAQAAHDIALANLEAEVAAEQRIAAAYGESEAAGKRAEAMEQGREQTLRDNTLSEQEYAAAILKRSAAQAQAASAQAITRAALSNQADERLLAASAQGPAAEIAARSQNEAIQQTQPEFDAANASGGADAYNLAQQHLQQLQQELQLRDQINQAIQANDEDRQLQQTLEEKQQELALMRQTPELRAQELADMQTRNQLIDAGYQENSQAFDDELAKRQQINEAIAQEDTAIQQVQKDQQVAKQQATEIGDLGVSAFKALTSSTGDFHSHLQTIAQDFEQLAEKILVIQPLEEMLTGLSGKLTGGGGLLSLIGGGSGGGGSSGGLGGSIWNWLTGGASPMSDNEIGAIANGSLLQNGSSDPATIALTQATQADTTATQQNTGGVLQSITGVLQWLAASLGLTSATAANTTAVAANTAALAAASGSSAGSSISGGGSGLGSLFGLIGGGSGGADAGIGAGDYADAIDMAAADGAAFDAGMPLRAYAKGGVVHPARRKIADHYRYTEHKRIRASHTVKATPMHAFAAGGVVNDPTYFQMASGTGLMGEAGPEAIMPLQRLPGGKLGVMAAGGGAGTSVTHYYDLRGNDQAAQLKAILARVNAVDASVERRSVMAVVSARRANPTLLQAHYG